MPFEKKPLFIPLKREFFERFASGENKIEYRKYGKRWNEHTCKPGRRVTLSCGYGKQRRLSGVITEFEFVSYWSDAVPLEVARIYMFPANIACIHIEVEHASL